MRPPPTGEARPPSRDALALRAPARIALHPGDFDLRPYLSPVGEAVFPVSRPGVYHVGVCLSTRSRHHRGETPRRVSPAGPDSGGWAQATDVPRQ